MASISISQSASASFDSRLRFRRQNAENATCPEGTKPCKDDNKKCATYCNGNPECTDGSDELDCATTASATITTIAVAQTTGSSGNEIDRANAQQGTTDITEATLPQVSIFDRETLSPADAGANEDTTEQSNTGAAETATAILADGTTIVLPPGTTATILADDVATATGIAVDGTTVGTATVEAITETNEVTATVVADIHETSTIIIVDNGTDAFTSIQPGNGHGTEAEDASNDTTTSVDGITVDTNITTIADNETSTEATTVHLATTIGAEDTDAYYDDENIEDTKTQDTNTVPSRGSDADEDDAIQDGDVKTTKTTPKPARGTTVSADDDVEYYDGDDDDEASPKVPSVPSAKKTTPPVQPEPGAGAALRVVVSPDVIQVQRGRTVELTCTVYGGDSSTNIYWIQEEPERRYAQLDPAGENDKQITASQVTLKARITLDDPSKIGKYTCTAQDSAGNSGSAVLTMQEGSGIYPPPVYPGVVPSPGGGRGGYLRIVAPDMTEGDYVEIQCEGAASEDESRIQWYFNNRLLEAPLLNDEQPLYPRGKTLHIRPISRPYLGNYRCTVPGGNYIDANSVLTFSGTAPSTGQPSQCNINEATCRNGRCIPRAYLCDGKNDCGDNSDESCGPQGPGGADVCQPNEIRCSDSNRGRKCVQKFWMCDGDRDCDDGTDEEQRYCELLPRQRYCKTSEFQCTGANNTYGNPVCIPRSFQCDGYNDCPDRSDEIGCVKPTVISPPQRQIQINAGETLTIRCTARGSPAPYINWRLNWGHICGDGSDNGRCTIVQSLDSNDPTLVTGTLTVRNVNANDGGAYSCEALNNQGFIFAIPDAIVNVIIDGRPLPTVSRQNCDPSGTYTERGGRCICKYNVEGDQCNQCKRNHFYLNPTTPNGCLPCFCSGVSSDCTSTAWRRHPHSLSLNNWNAVPKNFATDSYEAGDRIQQRQGGREIALDQNSLGRAANEVLYWKAPKEILGDFVTLYDGNIDIHFTNDGKDTEAPSNDEFIWLRGNNIDLVHKLPETQRFKANTNATYSVPVNERTFTRKDGTFIDRENILMALSDLDTFLVKINPIGGRRTAVLRGVTLNAAARDGYADAAPTVESCNCPVNYTGTSCEKCAEGYVRPRPLVGIYLGQCVPGDQYQPSRPSTGTGGAYYVDQKPYDPSGKTSSTVILDGGRTEQRIPLQVLNVQPQSVVWGRTDGSSLPPNVYQEGNDLVFRNPSPEQAGNYICTITLPDGSVDYIAIYVQYRPGQRPAGGAPPRVSIQPQTINLKEGQRMIVQYTVASHEPINVVWNKLTDQGFQPIPSLFSVEPNRLVLHRATPEAAGTYQVIVSNSHGEHRQELYINVQPRRSRQRGQAGSHQQGHHASQYRRVQWNVHQLNLDEGRRLEAVCRTDLDPSTLRLGVTRHHGQQNEQIPLGLTFSNGYLSLSAVTKQDDGLEFICSSGDISDILTLNVRSSSHDHDHSRSYIDVRLQSRDEQSHQIGRDIHLQCAVHGSVERPYEYTYTKDGRPLENNVEVHPGGLLIIRNAQAQDAGRYRCEVTFPRTPEAGARESSYDLRLDGGSGGSHDHHHQHGGDHSQQNEYVEVTVEPTEVTIGRGEKATIKCHVKGAQQYKVTWGKYAHDTSLPNYAHQEGNNVVIAPTDDTPAEQMYLQCQVDVPGQAQPHHAYAPVNIRGGDGSTILRKPKLLIEPSTHIRITKGNKLRIKCFDPYENYSTIISWFRKDNILIILPNQHSNGILDFDSVSDSDIGEYVCRGQNHAGFTEEIVTLELIGSPPSIIISPKLTNGYLQVPYHSTQTIECLNHDNTPLVDITWRRADTGDLDISKTASLFPLNMPLEFEHSGTYTCIATNEYGSTSETFALDVQQNTHEISIDIEPTNIFSIDSEIRFNCKLPQSDIIWWSSINRPRRENNPLIFRVGLNHINRRFVCHIKDINGKLHRKIIRIQRYSKEQLIAIIVNNEMERSLRHYQRKKKTPKIHIKLITSPIDIKAGGIIELHCYVEGFLPNKLSWSFQSGSLPNNTHITNDGHLLINNFDRFNLGIYTCSAETLTKRLSQFIDFQPNDIFNNIESSFSYQIYSSRLDYHFGGRLLIECISSDPNISKFWIKHRENLNKNLSESFLFINKINQKDIAQYQCLSSNETNQSSIYFNITQSNLLSQTFPLEKNSNIHIEFLSSINQLKLGGNILINCSSSDNTSVQWLLNKQINGIIINNSYLNIKKFSNKHFNYYYCLNKNTQKILVLSPFLFELIKNFNSKKIYLNKYNKSSIELIQGKYIGDNITLICRIGRDISQGKIIWSNIPKRTNHFYIRGPRLEFRPFKLEHHNQYKCLIKSKQSNEILRTLIFNTYSNIYEQIDRKPQMNLTIDTSYLLYNGELRLICNTDNLNKYHQWTFDEQIPRSKIHYELSMNNYTSIMIIPDFDFEVDSGKYECLTTNTFGTTMRNINIDKKTLKSKYKRQD